MTNNIPKVKVFQFDKQLNFIKEYESLHEASKATGIARRNIKYVCNKKRDTAGGYIWSYTREIEVRISKKQDKKVYQYNMRNYYVGEYNSISEAARETNTSRCNISKVALGKRLTANEYYWSYEGPITIIEDEKHPIKKRRIPNESILIEKRRKTH